MKRVYKADARMISRRKMLAGLAAAVVAPVVSRRTAAAVTINATNPYWTGAVGAADRDAAMRELIAVTRRAFVPRVRVQIYQASPFLAALRDQQWRRP